MRRRRIRATSIAAGLALAVSSSAFAQDSNGASAGALPPGHPAVGPDGAHHAAATGNHGAGAPGMFQPPEDTEQDDPTLRPGTIEVDLRDPDDKPVANEEVTLGELINSVAKGDSRKHYQQETDAGGRTIFSGLDMSANVAYRVSAGFQGGLFAAMPFRLAQGKAKHVVLHVYPVTRDISNALVVAEATIAAELRDDRIQIEEAFTIYNLGRTAWQPDGVKLPLPAGFTAFGAQKTMSDEGVDSVTGGAQLRGTFSPGQHPIEFRWQLPWGGDSNVDFDVGLPPHTAIVRVMLPATSGVKLEAGGFPPSEVRRDARGQSFLVTERRVRPDDPQLSSVAIGIHGLPTPGPGRKIATGLVALAMAAGLYFALRKRSEAAPVGPRPILEELLSLERAKADGEVGPKTYERVRRELLDALALALARKDPL